MRTTPIQPQDWRRILPVPPLARRADPRRTLDFEESGKVVRYLLGGGVTGVIYGGNAFLYHLTLAECGDLLDWLASIDDRVLVIPSAGPSYGRAMDQAPLLKKHRFPCVMMLPCGDPRDARGLEQGYREFADAAEKKLLVYLKDESNFGAAREAGLDAVARLVDDGVCVGIKYAVVRPDPRQDPYLEDLLRRVDRAQVISGIGERPAIVHMRDFGLPGFTTGSGCLAPALSNHLYELAAGGEWAEAESVRAHFLPVEDLRDGWGPARVLHAAVELAGIARLGPIAPYVSALSAQQRDQLAPAALALAAQRRAVTA